MKDLVIKGNKYIEEPTPEKNHDMRNCMRIIWKKNMIYPTAYNDDTRVLKEKHLIKHTKVALPMSYMKLNLDDMYKAINLMEKKPLLGHYILTCKGIDFNKLQPFELIPNVMEYASDYYLDTFNFIKYHGQENLPLNKYDKGYIINLETPIRKLNRFKLRKLLYKYYLTLSINM